MTTLSDVFRRIGEQAHGRIFLINLHHSLESRLVQSATLQPVLKRFLGELPCQAHELPDSTKLMNNLSGYFIVNDVWLDSSEPMIKRYRSGERTLLTRVMSYTGFYRMLRNATTRHPVLPRPRAPDSPRGGEIADSAVDRVRAYVDSGEWLGELYARGIDMHCVWLTACSELDAHPCTPGTPLPDHYRDLIGLWHLGTGRHLIRFDIDLSTNAFPRFCKFRRPHGAGNGGPRFRARHDGPEEQYGWGHTVNLRHVERHSTDENINGVPELLIGDFTASPELISSNYVGRITCDPEREDDYFIGRLSAYPIDTVIEQLCWELMPCH